MRIARQTLCDWVGAVAELLEPVVAHMRERGVLASEVIHSDDTPIRLLEPGRGCRTGYLWVYGVPSGELVYDFTAGRSRDGPLAFLGDWKGYLQADGYSGCDEVYRTGQVIEVGCWAHARRRFFEATKTAVEGASRVIGHIRLLYRVEREATEAGLGPEQRCQVRERRSRPLLAELGALLAELAPRHLPKSPMGEAIGYARRQWEALGRYVEDGRLEIDNNRSGRALRMVAVGRRNWLFAGSRAGGRSAAILYSLIATAKNLGLDPFVYLRDVIARVAGHPMRRIGELTPRGWKAEREGSVLVPA